jgi:hypothetical protein
MPSAPSRKSCARTRSCTANAWRALWPGRLPCDCERHRLWRADLVDHRPLAITDAALIEKLDGLKFVSATVELRPAAANDAPRQETGDPFTLPSPHAPSSGGCCG